MVIKKDANVPSNHIYISEIFWNFEKLQIICWITLFAYHFILIYQSIFFFFFFFNWELKREGQHSSVKWRKAHAILLMFKVYKDNKISSTILKALFFSFEDKKLSPSLIKMYIIVQNLNIHNVRLFGNPIFLLHRHCTDLWNWILCLSATIYKNLKRKFSEPSLALLMRHFKKLYLNLQIKPK